MDSPNCKFLLKSRFDEEKIKEFAYVRLIYFIKKNRKNKYTRNFLIQYLKKNEL